MELKPYTPDDYIHLIGKAVENALKNECLIIFFGSILTDKFSRTSDIDVGVYCGRPLTAKEYVNILNELEKAPILRDVDLIDLAEVKNEEFLSNVLDRGKVWKSSEELLESLKKR